MSELGCPILHLDMDAFYAAVEQRDNPALRGQPVIVGAPPNQRGVVCTASYEARRFGVHSAMPSRTAYKKCPHGIFLPVRMDRYQEVSDQIMAILHEFTPIVEPVSVDEAFLDVRGVLHAWDGDAVNLARALRQRIRGRLDLTASVGVAPNKFLAKLASDLEKPDGLTVIPSDAAAIVAFLEPLPVRKIWGVGEVTAERLAGVGIRTIGQIQRQRLPELTKLLGEAFARHIWELAHGRDDRTVIADPVPEKSISNEETFIEDCADLRVVRQTLVELTENVGRRLRNVGRRARTAQIKVRFGDFKTITRQQSFAGAVSSDRDLLAAALGLLDHERISRPVRLIGFGVSSLVDEEGGGEAGGQLLLFPDEPSVVQQRDAALDSAVDRLRHKYGPDILKRGDWRR
ncbi:MAG: hypothetical protein A3K18_29105 [Lentisphaerae bacterium RIFOXYA12_64_32]|nr:MAG: hypothetical protein A3K18_29105 [Lentisphaerae bacterium RIFOXYA12_64_32]